MRRSRKPLCVVRRTEGSNPSPSASGRSERRLRSVSPARWGPKPPLPSAPRSTWRKPPPPLGIRRKWRAGSHPLPARSGRGSNVSDAAIAVPTTGPRRACPGRSRSSRSTGSGPRRCRTCGRASSAGHVGRGGPRRPVSPQANRETPTAHLSPVEPTRYRPRRPSRVSTTLHPTWHPGIMKGRRMPASPTQSARGVRRPCPGPARRRPPTSPPAAFRSRPPRLRSPEGHREPTRARPAGSMGRNPQLAV
jgi:hypothetical protein